MITAMKRRKAIHTLHCAGVLFLALLVSGCVGKKPDDDVALIKQVLGKLERGLNQRRTVVLDSVTLDEKRPVSSDLLDSLSAGHELQGARIAKKSFTIVGDSAEVRLVLTLQHATDEGQARQTDKPLSLFLNKRKGKWRISGFSTASRSEQEGKE